MAITSETLLVAECDAPSCHVRRTSAPDEYAEGFHVTVLVAAGGAGEPRTVEVFSHSAQHIGPAANAAIRQLPALGDEVDDTDGEGNGPQVPQRPAGEVDLGDDDDEADPRDDDGDALDEEASLNGAVAR